MERSEKKNLAVFSGVNSIQDFLNPDNNPYTPLVELPPSLNPFFKERIHILAKCEYLRPLLNIKSLQVFGMLQNAQSIGVLSKEEHTLIENTSGNTGFSMGILAKLFGIQKVKAIVPYDIAPGKLEMLRLVGLDIEPCKVNGIKKAREMGTQKGFLNLDQYGNSANPVAIKKWLAPQIWEQTQGMIDIFCAGLGTTGTIIGVSDFLKSRESRAYILGAILEAENAVPGVRTKEKLQEVNLRWKHFVNSTIEVKAKESYKMSLELCRSGIMGGPSSGLALAGLIKFLHLQLKNGMLESLSNKNGQIRAVFICPDTPFPYLDKYSTQLDPTDF